MDKNIHPVDRCCVGHYINAGIDFFLFKRKIETGECEPHYPYTGKNLYTHFEVVFEVEKTTIAVNIIALATGIIMMTRLGSEFMPPLDEGSLLFMPVTLPDVSNSEAKRLLQVQDKLIRTVPEVSHVLGKAGRANTATDNSPISMIETIILLKPKHEWRKGLTKDDIINELNSKMQIPGLPTDGHNPSSTVSICFQPVFVRMWD